MLNNKIIRQIVKIKTDWDLKIIKTKLTSFFMRSEKVSLLLFLISTDGLISGVYVDPFQFCNIPYSKDFFVDEDKDSYYRRFVDTEYKSFNKELSRYSKNELI